MFTFRSSPVVKTNAVCMRMNNRNQHKTRKCSDRATWILSSLLSRRKLVESAGDMPRPVSIAAGAAMKIVTKYASCCSALYAIQLFPFGQSSDRYWITTEAAAGITVHVVGTTRRHCPVEKSSTKTAAPFESHSTSEPRCHQRA